EPMLAHVEREGLIAVVLVERAQGSFLLAGRNQARSAGRSQRSLGRDEQGPGGARWGIGGREAVVEEKSGKTRRGIIDRGNRHRHRVRNPDNPARLLSDEPHLSRGRYGV